MNIMLALNYLALGAISAFRIVKFDSDGVVTLATTGIDASIGISDNISIADGERCDVHRLGVVDIEYGGNVTAGQPLVPDALGRAVPASPGSGVNLRIIGFAEVDGAFGDIGKVLLNPSVMQGE
jgi:Uncharacterized conserved protein (DUF2190)